MAVCHGDGVFDGYGTLLPVAREAVISVGQCSEGVLDAPSERQGLEALSGDTVNPSGGDTRPSVPMIVRQMPPGSLPLRA